MMWTRRQLGVATFGMGARLPGTWAADARFALAPYVVARWAKHRNESAPRLVQLVDGVRLESGPMGAPDRNGLAIWSRASWTAGNFSARFKTKKHDGNVSVADESLFLLLYFGVQGDATAGHPVNLADWPGSTVPYTHTYADHIRGARISFYYQAPGANSETGPLGCAYFRADGSRDPVHPKRDVVFPGLRGVTYGWTVRRVGTAVTITQKDRDVIRGVTFANAALGQYAATGSFGLLVAPGRDVEVTNFSVAKT